MEDYYWDTANETKMGDYLTRKEREFIDSFLEDNNIGTCLDVACGSGRFSIPISQAGINVVAVDYNLVPLKKLKAKNGKSLSIQICRGDANKLPFKKSSFDCIVSIETVDYLDAEKFISQCNKLRTYAFETLFSISVDVFCTVHSISTNIRYADADFRHSNA